MIRLLRPSDLDEIESIEKTAHLFPWTKTQLDHHLHYNNLNFGYWDQKEMCGFIFLQKLFPEAEILNIAVAPIHQGKKIGKILLMHALSFLEEENYKSVFLEVRRTNKKAINLYEHCGFNQIAVRKNYYPTLKGKEDALIYAKDFFYE